MAVVVATLCAVGVGVVRHDASALAGTTERVSLTSSGAQETGDAQTAPALSSDGRFVAFFSRATNLVPGAPGSNIFLRDRTAGTTELVSVANDGSVGNAGSGGGHGPAISADGRFVAFESDATNLVAGDTNAKTDIFVRDRLLATTERVSVSSAGAQADTTSVKPSISADGRFVVFQSAAQGLAPEDGICCDDDVFVRDRQTGTTSRVSVKRLTTNGVEPAGNSDDGDISADGRYVAFIGPCDTLAPCTGFLEPQVFLRDLQTNTTSQLTFGNSGQGAKNNPDVNSDGSRVVFEAAGTDLVPGDTNNTGDVFVVNSATKAITRASVDSAGNQGNDNSSSGLEGPAISGDGTKVAFESFATNLVVNDTNGKRDVFVHDLSTGATTRESVDAAGDEANGNSTGSAISADGAWVGFVSSATNLVSDDTNAHLDAFVHQLSDNTTTTSTTSDSSSSSSSSSSTSTSSPTSSSSTTSSSTTTSTSTTTTTRPPVAPRITSLRPSRGSNRGGTVVTIAGRNLNGGTAYIDGSPVPTQPCHAATGSGTRRPSANICFTTPTHVPGPVSITVHLPNGQVSNAASFAYIATPPPVIASSRGLSPDRGPDVGGTPVVVQGANLDVGTVFVDGTAVPTTECKRRSAGAVTLCFTTPPHAPGGVAVTVHTPDGAVSNPFPFTYFETPAPQIAHLTPSAGFDVGGTRVRVTGANLDQGVVLVDGTPTATTECGAAPSARVRPVDLCFTTSPHAIGTAVLTVATPNGKSSNPVSYTFQDTPTPVISSVRPVRISTAGGTLVTVVGDYVSQGTVYIDGQAVTSQACTAFVGAFPGTHEKLCFVAPAHPAGTVTVVVHTPNGKASGGAPLTYEVTRRR